MPGTDNDNLTLRKDITFSTFHDDSTFHNILLMMVQ